MVNVAEGGENNEYRGTTFKTWFSFGKDNETKEEYVAYGGPLYQLLGMVAPKLDEVFLEDEDLSEREYERFIKKSVKMLDELDVVARVGVRVGKKDENKKNNFLMPRHLRALPGSRRGLRSPAHGRRRASAALGPFGYEGSDLRPLVATYEKDNL